MIGAVEIIVSDLALKDTDVRLFPASRHRSRRIHKKLVKRHGGEFEKRPCAYQFRGQWIVHPTLWTAIQKRSAEKARDLHERSFYGAFGVFVPEAGR